MFALNQGEVCTCPSRALIQESIYDAFMERAMERVTAIVAGDPLDPATMIGAQASNDQLEKILSYLDIGKAEGAERSEEHTSELQSLMRISYAVFCLKKKKNSTTKQQ